MADLRSRYMGVDLQNPLIVGACSYTAHMDHIRRIEDSGAGAFVVQSLFEEQIQLQKFRMEDDVHLYDHWHAEMQSVFPDVQHAGPDEHLMWVRKAKEAVRIPVFASLNAVNAETWVDWAKKLEETGVDGLELNFFSIPTDAGVTGGHTEDNQIQVLTEVKAAVKIPVAVKLSAFYTNPIEVIRRMDGVGVGGFVLFNRMFHPSFDIETETLSYPFNLSNRNDHRMALRFAALLSGEIAGSICASNGIHNAADAIEVLLAGADAFQCVSTLYLNDFGIVQKITQEIARWMERKGYPSINDFRGKLNARNSGNKWTFRRSQYVKMLLNSDKYLERPTLI